MLETSNCMVLLFCAAKLCSDGAGIVQEQAADRNKQQTGCIIASMLEILEQHNYAVLPCRIA